MERILINTGPSPRGWHRIEQALRCPMAYYWHAKAAGTREPSEPLIRGTLLHTALAHKYAREAAVVAGVDPDQFYDPWDAVQRVAIQHEHLGVMLAPVAMRMFNAHEQTYGRDSLVTVGIECLLETHFSGACGDYWYTAHADRVVRYAGKIRIMDHKGVGRIEDKVFARYALSGQFLGLHHLGVRTYGDEFGGILLNVIDVKGRCVRREIEPAPWALQKFPAMVAHAEHVIATVEAALASGDASEIPMAISELVCMTPYGPCEHFDRCRWGR